MAPPAKQAAKGQQQVRMRSFLVGTQDVIEGGDYDVTNVVTNGIAYTPWVLQATGWLRGLVLLVQGTGLTAGTVTADGPFIAFGNIELDDVNNEAIFGPFDGYTAYLTNKYGGYAFWDDPATQSIFTYTGTVTTNNFTFALYIPLEIVMRDPLGAVPSVNNTASLTLKMSANPTSSTFTTVTGTLSIRIRGHQLFYWEPKKADKQGRPISPEPPASGTTQYWTQGSIAIAGASTINSQLITGLGYPFRTYAFLLRDGTGSRANGETNWPDPLIGLKFEANMLVSQFPKVLWQQFISKMYGYSNPTADTRAGGSIPGKENGVYLLNWNKEFAFLKPGSETRRNYLITSPGSNFIFNGAIGGAGTLYSVVNYIASGGKATTDTARLTGGN
jgi:hypothetical protein